MKNRHFLIFSMIALSAGNLFGQTTSPSSTSPLPKTHHVGKKTYSNFAIGTSEDPVTINEYNDFLNQKGTRDDYFFSYKYYDDSFMKSERQVPSSTTCIIRSGSLQELQYSVEEGHGDEIVDAVPSQAAQKEFQAWRIKMSNYPTSQELCSYINARLTYLHLQGTHSKILVANDEEQLNYINSSTEENEAQADSLKTALKIRYLYPNATKLFNTADGLVRLAPDHFFNRETWDDNGGITYLEGIGNAESPAKNDLGSSQDPLHFLEKPLQNKEYCYKIRKNR